MSQRADPRPPQEAGEISGLDLEPADNSRLANLCGPFDEHLRQLERSLEVRIDNRGSRFQVHGARAAVACRVLKRLYSATEEESLTAGTVHLYLQRSGVDELLDSEDLRESEIRTRRSRIRTRGRTSTTTSRTSRAAT